MSQSKVDVVLMWHMHQPDYRDAVGGRFLLPWVYLHAIKDYADMAAHLERHPGVRAVVNFVPVLLDQLDDYARQFDDGVVRDPLLGLLQVPDLDRIEPAERALVLDSCFHNNHETMLQPYPHYRRLHELFKVLDREETRCYDYLSGTYLADLLTWYHLVWVGETERRSDPLYARLMAKGERFTHEDRLQLFHAIGAIVRRLPERYRALAADGRVELSTTPFAHPLAPLMHDFACARDTVPDAALPSAPQYPGGPGRVDWHLRDAIASHARRFGSPPTGLWPAEGAISEPFLTQVAASGLRWAASSETVLGNSLSRAGADLSRREQWLYRGWRLARAPGTTLFFRDERLSDQIGFEYSKWHGRDAALHLVGELHRIGAQAPDGEVPLVVIALDGENAWEYYPFNGYYFFEELYGALAADPSIRTRTFADCVADPSVPSSELPSLVAGSWVLGTLSTWIGEAGKNRAWDLLCEAKHAVDAVFANGELEPARRELAERQLAACEGSDWFWWLGPFNPEHAVERFDRLFRHNLARLYELIGRPAPAALEQPLSHGLGHPEIGGAMRRAAAEP